MEYNTRAFHIRLSRAFFPSSFSLSLSSSSPLTVDFPSFDGTVHSFLSWFHRCYTLSSSTAAVFHIYHPSLSSSIIFVIVPVLLTLHRYPILPLKMRSSISIVLGSLLALAAAENSNPFNIPNGGYTFKAGEPTTVKWNPTSDGTVSLKLQSGELLTPDGGTTIACECSLWGSESVA